jgi:hypothetical protein
LIFNSRWRRLLKAFTTSVLRFNFWFIFPNFRHFHLIQFNFWFIFWFHIWVFKKIIFFLNFPSGFWFSTWFSKTKNKFLESALEIWVCLNPCFKNRTGRSDWSNRCSVRSGKIIKTVSQLNRSKIRSNRDKPFRTGRTAEPDPVSKNRSVQFFPQKLQFFQENNNIYMIEEDEIDCSWKKID